MPPIHRTMRPFEWALLLALSLLWGGSFLFQGVAVRELPTLTIVMSRVALAAMILLVVVRVTATTVPLSRSVLTAFLVMGILNNAIPFALIVWGQAQVAAGVASILNATTPLFGVIVAHLATADEPLSSSRLAGVLAGVVGVAVMLGIGPLAATDLPLMPALACLAAAFSYALAGVFGRRFRRMGVAPLATAAGQLTASTLVLAPLWLVLERPWTLAAPGLTTVAALLALAVVSTALAYVIYFRILATAGATNLLLVTLLVPPSAILLGIVFLDEVLRPPHVVGLALIATGLALIDGRLVVLARRAVRGKAA